MCGCPIQGHLGPLTVSLGGGMPACLQPQTLPHKMPFSLWWHLQLSPPYPHGPRGICPGGWYFQGPPGLSPMAVSPHPGS